MGLLKSDTVQKLRGLEEKEFKKCVADMYEETTMSAGTNSDELRILDESDGEPDIVIEHAPERMTAVHCVQAGNDEEVTEEAVKDCLKTIREHDNVEFVEMVTTGELTDDAEWKFLREDASEILSGGDDNVDVIQKEGLRREVREHGAGYIVDWYAEKEPDGRRLEDASEDEVNKPIITRRGLFWSVVVLVLLALILLDELGFL